MSMTKDQAYSLMVAHHRQLGEGVERRVAALEGAVDGDGAFEIARAELVAYLAEEVLPHALAEEHTVYAEAAKRPEMAETVSHMVAEHRDLASGIEKVAASGAGAEAAAHARSVANRFATHVTQENDVLLPVMMADESVDVAGLLSQMHELTRASHDEAPAGTEVFAADHEALVLSQLLVAATELASAGQGDRACALVAATWATLRGPRPDLANKVNVALHRLVRLVSSEPVTLQSKPTGGAAIAGPLTDLVLDVRPMAPAQRHETIFRSYAALQPGGAFLLINDHDPKPLKYQFEAEHADEFTWDYLEAGPKEWRVRIGRTALVDAGPAGRDR
jgi:uncharacterized protein (DUF2249 family)/iron-sulfur cluster repair protein YtfE (RIC family)